MNNGDYRALLQSPRAQVSELGLSALDAFARLRRAKPSLAHGEPAAKRDSFSEVVLVGRLREAIRRMNPAIPEEARATIKRYLKVRFERRLNP